MSFLFFKSKHKAEALTGNGMSIRRAVTRLLIERNLSLEEISKVMNLKISVLTKYISQIEDNSPATVEQLKAIDNSIFMANHGMPRQSEAWESLKSINIIKSWERPLTKTRASEILSLLHYADAGGIAIFLLNIKKTRKKKIVAILQIV